jgi:Tfp pilus assembly protein PilF
MNPRDAIRPVERIDAAVRRLLGDAVERHQAGQLEQAKSLYLQILAIELQHGPSLYGLGLIAQQSGSFEIAANMMHRAIALDPGNTDYRFGLGAALQANGNYDAALAAFREVLQADAENLLAHFRVGNILQLQGKLDEAIAAYERIVELNPDSHDAEFNIGNVFRLQGKLAEARERYRRALNLQPGNVDALWNLSLLDLLEGDYPAGWKNYEVRHRRPTHGLREFAQPQWKGEPLNGSRILIHSEQGLGDTLQFLRYLPMVAQAGGEITLDVPATLRRLAGEIPGISAVISSGDAIPPFAWHCPMMSLPLAFHTTVESIPAQMPYLRIPQEAKRSAAKLPWPQQSLRVGLVWGATTRSFEDSDRSIPFALLEPILATPRVHFYSLQLGPPASQLAPQRTEVIDLRGVIGDFADTAALVFHLDLVLTVDTSVAHVAGALAKPTWVLLPFSADWRWMTSGEDSPWYASVRLFRQPRQGDWEAVIERVRCELASLARPSG